MNEILNEHWKGWKEESQRRNEMSQRGNRHEEWDRLVGCQVTDIAE